MPVSATLRWYFPSGTNLDSPPGTEPAVDISDLDGDGVLDPSPVAGSTNPDVRETARVSSSRSPPTNWCLA